VMTVTGEQEERRTRSVASETTTSEVTGIVTLVVDGEADSEKRQTRSKLYHHCGDIVHILTHSQGYSESQVFSKRLWT